MLTPVTVSGNYLKTGGRRFIPIGVNWVPAGAAMQWPYEWDPASIKADFAKMQDLGLNLVRFDLVWQWFEPRPGQYNEEAFRQFDFFIDLAHKDVCQRDVNRYRSAAGSRQLRPVVYAACSAPAERDRGR